MRLGTLLLAVQLLACGGPIDGTPLEGNLIAAGTATVLAETNVNEIPLVNNGQVMILVEKSNHPLWVDFKYNIATKAEAVMSIKARPASPDTYREVDAYMRGAKGIPSLVSPWGESVMMWEGPAWKHGRTVYLLEADGTTSIMVRGLLKGLI